MNFIRTLKNGKSQIAKDVAFCHLLNNQLPEKNKPMTTLINEFDKAILSIDKSISKDALNNVHGDWYEWLLAIEAWNFFIENKENLNNFHNAS